MNSILKILLGLKLTFILIIFGIGGTYVLEHSAQIRWKQPSEPVSFIQTGEIMVAEPENPVIEKNTVAEETPVIAMPGPIESGKIVPSVYSLSDLGLHIEL